MIIVVGGVLATWAVQEVERRYGSRTAPKHPNDPPLKQDFLPLHLTKLAVTSLILAMQCYEYLTILGIHERPHKPRAEWMSDVRFLGSCLSALYAYELLFRRNMKPHTQAHHILAVGMITYLIVNPAKIPWPVQREVGLLWLFQGTTEQITLLGLVGLRTGWNSRLVSKILFAAAFQTGFVKLLSLCTIMYRWRIYLDSISGGWNWLENGNVMWLFAIGLVLTQIRSSPISLAHRLRSQSRDPKHPVSAPLRATLNVTMEEVEKSVDSKLSEALLPETKEMEVAL